MRKKVKSKQDTKKATDETLIVSDELDKMQDDLEKVLQVNEDGKKTNVKLIRSRRETRVVFIFKGNTIETEERLQKIYKSLVS